MTAAGERLRRDLDAMCAETLERLRERRPDLVHRFPPDLLDEAIRSTHRRAVDLLGGTETPRSREAAVDLGRRAATLGLDPQDVMAGYRVGAEVAHGRVRALLIERAAPTETVLEVWAWTNRFFDDLTARTDEGVRSAAAAHHGRRARARQALVDALLDAVPVPAVLEAEAGWPLPDRLVVVLARGGELDPPEDQAVLARRDGDLLAVVDAGSPWLEDPGPAGRSDPVLVLGPSVPAEETPAAWGTVRRLTELAGRSGAAPAVLRAEDHLLDLVLAGDPWAAQVLPERELAPLAEVPPRSRPLIEETLRAWLADPDHPGAIAARLFLHPQTVHYRLRRLRAVFGDGLDDAERRFALAVALRLRDGPSVGPGREVRA